MPSCLVQAHVALKAVPHACCAIALWHTTVSPTAMAVEATVHTVPHCSWSLIMSTPSVLRRARC